MVRFLQRGLTVILLSGMVLAALPVHAATDTRERVGRGILKEVETANRLNGDVYVLDHKKVDGNTTKRLYRITDAATGELEQLNTVRGSKKVHDVTFAFDGDLYMTATPKKGAKVNVYRSQDQGVTWSNVAQVGFALSGVRNEIVQNFTFNGRIFVVLTQNTVADNDDNRTLAIWSSSNGTDWDYQELSYAGKDMIYKDYAATDSTGYLLVSSDLSSGYDPTVYSVTDTTFTQLSNVGITPEPLYTASDIMIVNDVILVSGWINFSIDSVVLTSTNGVDWTTLSSFSNETASYTGYPDLFSFQGVGYILHQDFNSSLSSVLATDGTTTTAATLGFEDNLPTGFSDTMTINLTVSTAGNRLFASVYDMAIPKDIYCGVMSDTGVWQTTDYCTHRFKLGVNHRFVNGIQYKGTDTAIITDQYVYGLSGTHLYRLSY